MKFIVAVLCCFVCLPALAQAPYNRRPRRTTVPPHLEIEVLDPGVDPLGRPRVIVEEQNSEMTVRIPPTVLVHRYYYTGDREFRGPMLQGGPSIVVVNHPRTGEQCYIPLQLPPGSPQVKYTSHAIEYHFGASIVKLSFGLWGKPQVKYAKPSWQDQVTESVENSAASQRVNNLAADAKGHTADAFARLHEAGDIVKMPAQQILGYLPFGQMLRSTGEDGYIPGQYAADKQREREQEQAYRQKLRSESTRRLNY